MKKNILSFNKCPLLRSISIEYFPAALNDALKKEVERLKFATGEVINNPDAYNMNPQQFPQFSQPPYTQQQPQQLSFHHQNLKTHCPQFPQPLQHHPQFSQPQPTFSDQQLLAEQQHDQGFIKMDQGLSQIDHNFPHMMLVQDQVMKMQGMEINSEPQFMQSEMQELDISADSQIMQPENCTFSPCESSHAF